MEDNVKMFDLLFEKVIDFSKTSIELGKLKVIDKITDLISSIVPHTFVFILFCSFLIFFNVGLAFWLGDILGKVFYGFFAVSAIYILIGGFIHFVMHKWLKKQIGNYLVKQLLK